ncbi:hypothetical protein [Pseudodesulfovibrio pelocollis]|uniref:hypothetical protein n=1 Tax=Pseudodesulfovibrio pelocollis TaxID=3051432 RepID=UPI00255AD165|nr:hypothetical protein [Pseudodesulfovibrio sp. SB368]
MLFDIFCGCVERHLPELRDLVAEAKLFVFEGAPHEFLKARPGYHEKFDESLFYLPFPVVAVEDAGSLVILADVNRDNHVGLNRPRTFIDVQGINVDRSNFEHTTDLHGEALEYLKKMQRDYPKAITVNVGELTTMTLDQDIKRFRGVFRADRSVLVDKKAGILFEDSLGYSMKESMRPAASNAQVAIEELAMLTRDKDFVFEQTPAKSPKVKKGAIPRSHERPQYTILQPDQIRKIMEVKNPTEDSQGTKRAPHERRRHYKWLVPGEGKPWKKEQRIVVNACWVGISEKEIRGKIYRVRLDV